MNKRQVKKEVDFRKKWGGTGNVKDQQTTSFDRMSDSHTGGRFPEKINLKLSTNKAMKFKAAHMTKNRFFTFCLNKKKHR